MNTLRLEYNSGLVRNIPNVIDWDIWHDITLIVETNTGREYFVLVNLLGWRYVDGA